MSDLARELEASSDFSDLFSLVKKSVRKSLGEHRVGLMLYLGDLPMRIGAFHSPGTNDIVLNRRLLNKVTRERPPMGRKAFLFTILLHEYLHSLGYLDEKEVRGLVYQISVENLGKAHPVTQMAMTGPWVNLTDEELDELGQVIDNLELVRDFERPEHQYII